MWSHMSWLHCNIIDSMYKHVQYDTLQVFMTNGIVLDLILSFLSSNIQVQPAYGVYISQLVRIGRICVEYEDL